MLYVIILWTIIVRVTAHHTTISIVYVMNTKPIKMSHLYRHADSVAIFVKKRWSMDGQILTTALIRLVIYFWCHIFVLNAVLKIRPVCGVILIHYVTIKYEHSD